MKTTTSATDDLDAEAMGRAIAMCRAESKEMHEHYDGLLAERDWWDVGESAAYHCQMEELGLDPWRLAPCHAHVTMPRRDEAAIALRREMIEAGLSIYEPTPLRALAAAEKRRKARPKSIGAELT